MGEPRFGETLGTLNDLLRTRAREMPEKTAFSFLVDGEQAGDRLRYGELDARARSIAAQLVRAGAVGERALLLYPPGLEFAAAFFGCLYAGTVAVPAYPPARRTLDRLRSIALDAQPRVALTTAGQRARYEALLGKVPELGGLHWLATDEAAEAPAGAWSEPPVGRDALALLQYTSGSTAAPKGVEITHGNLLSNEEMIRQAFGQSSDSVVVGWLPVYHDMGLIGNLLQPIYSGGSCVLMSPMAFLRKPLRWLQAISRCRATTSGGPNFAYDLCVDRIDEAALADLDLSSWQVAFSGAEPVRAGTLERFAERFAPCGFRDEAFFPCYGLAEATLLVSGGELGTGSQVRAFDASALEAHRAIPPVDDVHGAGQELVACGHSWLDQEVLVVDPESCRQCLADQVGEIWVSGPAVARGYWRNPEASARDFGARLADAPQAGPFLRTGDLGFIADGALFVTGRLKDLIILRGRNLYPQDIERTVVTSHPALGADCAAFSVDLDGEERLIVVAERARRAKAEAGEVAEAARRAVAEVHEARIQDFLLLSTGTLPKTSSGKVRRRACRDGYLDDALAVLGRSATTPSGERLDAATFDRGDLLTLEPAEQRHLLERFLRRHLARVLGATDALDRHRPLTAVGLDSLAAVELSTAIEDGTGVAMTPATLLEGSSLTHLGEAILDRLDRADERAISAEGGVTGDHPLSYGQQALWFLHRLAPASGAYNISAAARLRGTLDSDRLRRCFEILVERHPALRTCFSQQGDALVQRVADTRSVSLAFEWQLEDAGQLGAEALRARLADAAYRPFELQELPLLRVLVLRRAADEHVLLLSVHHAVADFWSLAVLVDELGEVYASLSGGRSVLLPAVERRYTDFARWQQQHLAGSAGRRLEGYWRGQLAGQPTALDLPTDRPRPPVQTYRGSTRQRRLPDPLSAALDRLAQAQDATPFVTLLATFQTLLHRYSGQNDVVVGSPVSGRGRRELAGVVGYFVNPLALRSRLAGDPRFLDHLAATRRAVLDGLRYQDLPFDRLVDRLQPERDPSRSPVFQVMFSWQQAPPQVAARGLEAFALGQSGAQLELGGLHWESIELPQRTAQLDATLLAAPDTAGVRLSMQYNCDLFDPSTIDRLLGHFERLLAGACAAPGDRLSTLPLLGRSEQRELLHARNATRAEVPGDLAMQGLIAPWIRSTPDGVAITHGDSVLTYSALGRRTTALARRLRQLGLTAESRVAICLEPGPEMVIGLLAVLTAGGTYVPLDPAYPEERLAFMLRDARNASPPQILLTDRSSRERLSDLAEPGTRIVELDEASSASPESEEPEAGATVRGGSAAYVIYTSGSTGRPKGVVIPHRAVVNFLTSMARRPGLGASDALLAVTTLAFDISVLEIFLPLTVGGRLALVDRQTASDGRALAQALGDARATCMQATPATWRLLVEGGWQGESELRMLCGGEALPRELADRLLPLGGELWNMYGPTETTIWSATCPVESTGPVAIGGPIANTRIYLLGAHLEPVPVGAVGEVYIAGRGLARGYLGRPRLTAERFLPDPLATSGQGGRLYRVGDRARHLAPGGFDFLGRTDHQVKLRGFRIEPGEIESALAHHPAVGECAVVVRDAAAGDRRLEAYLVAEEPVPDVAELRQLLRRSLPEHMIPSAFIGLDEMPRTPNGKLDRTALRPSVSSARTLPAPGPATASIKTSEPTADDAIEAEVTELWQQVLGVTSVGRDESFFDVGGHSLLLARLHSRLVERFRRQDLTLVDLFRHPTITAQARFLRGEQPPSLAPVSGEPAPAGASEETEIAIVGLAGRFPGAADAGGLWQNLRQGVESIRFFSDDELADWVDARTLADPSYVKAQGVLDRAAHFDAGFFGFNPREAELMDPQHRLFLECAWEAIEDAGFDPRQVPGAVGVFAGVGLNTYLLLAGREALESAAGGYQAFISNDKDFVPTRVSYKLGLTGPSVNVQTACSSSLVAVHLACRSLLDGESDMALAGGVTVRFPQEAGYVHRTGGILSADGHCRAFADGSSGTVLGNGLGIVVLKRLTDALADGDSIRAVIKGSAINNDGGAKIGYTAPSEAGQARVLQQALQAAGVGAETLSYVEAHGTGTELGDPIEIAALQQVFADHENVPPCALGSIKTNIGHLDTAAGIAGLIKAVLALQHRELPPSLHFEAPNPRIDFASGRLYVNRELQPWTTDGTPRRAGVSSFGIGGTNAHVVLEEAPMATPGSASRPRQLLVLSARSQPALDAATHRLAERLADVDKDLDLADVAYTLQTGRGRFAYRRVLVATDRAEAAESLSGGEPGRLLSSAPQPESPGGASSKVVFLLPGQGAQYPGMASGLYEHEAVFRRELDRCAQILQPELGLDLRQLLLPGEGAGEDAARQLRRTALAQPAIFAVEYALARLWSSWGIEPAAMVGHSIGEWVAACLAGVFEPPDALRLVALRGRLMQDLPTGSMLAVARPVAEIEALLGREISIAALNSPTACVVAGPDEAIAALENRLAEESIRGRRLHTSHAFHSAMMQPAVAPFAEAVAECRLSAPRVPFASNLTGEPITEAQAIDPNYWGALLTAPVRFAEGVAAFAAESPIFVEVGPGNTLSSLGRQQAPGCTFVASLPHPQDRRSDEQTVLEALGRLWLGGVRVDWPGFYGAESRRRVALPTYPFEGQRYWLEAARPQAAESVPTSQGAGEKTGTAHLLAKRENLAEWFYAPVWKQSHRPRARRTAAAKRRRWLLLVTESELGRTLAEGLRAEGQDVVTVIPGDGLAKLAEDAYTLAPSRASEVRQLLAEVGDVERVVHGFGLSSTDPDPLARAEEVRSLGLGSLWHLLQALAAAGSDPVELTVLTHQAFRIGGESELYPEQAMLPALLESVPQEIPRLSCRAIDLVFEVGAAEGVDQGALNLLVRELLAPIDPPMVALRSGSRWTRGFEALPMEAAGEAASVLSRGAVVLITGGLGGVGLELAEELAVRLSARLVLVGRSELPERSTWQTWSETHGEDDPTSRRLARLAAIEAAGGEVLTLVGDVTDPGSMTEVVRQARQHFGPIEGVIHAAGVAGGGSLKGRAIEAVDAVLAPKVRGTLVLEQTLAEEPLEVFLLCSSITAVAGGFGQGDYAAANAFLDAFASSRSRHDGPQVVSLGWDRWPGIGLAGNGRGAVHPLLGERILETPQREVYRQVLTASSHWALAEHRIVGHPTLPGTAYLEMARAAFAERAAGDALVLRQVFFLLPLAIAGEERREVLTVVDHPGESSSSSFRVLSRRLDRSAAPWRQHARGQVGVAAAEPVPTFDLDEAAKRCGEALTDRSQLAATRSDFLDTGRRWQTLQRLHLAEGEALAELALSSEDAGDLRRMTLHPALLDVAAGFIQLTREGNYLPLAYEELRLDGPLPEHLWSHAVLRDGGAETVQADVTLFDTTGTPRVRIRGFSMRRVSEQSAVELAQRRAAAGEAKSGTGAPSDASLALLDEGVDPGGGRESLWRLLGNETPAHLVVSPRDLEAVTEAYRSLDPSQLLSELTELERPGAELQVASAGGADLPAAELESLIAKTWQRLLGIDRIGLDDNFFELGGTSLIGVEVIAELKQRLGRDIPAVSLFEAPTVRGLAATLRPAESSEPAFARAQDRMRKKKAALAKRKRARRRPVEGAA